MTLGIHEFTAFQLAPLSLTPSRPGEFHPEPLTDPDLNLSIHPARAIDEELPPFVKTAGSSCRQLTL